MRINCSHVYKSALHILKLCAKWRNGKDHRKQSQVQKTKRDNLENTFFWLLNTSLTYIAFFTQQIYSPPFFPPANITMHLHSLHTNQITVEGDNQECNYLELKFIAGFQAKRVAQEYTFDSPTYTHHSNCDRNDIRNVKNVCGGWRGR